MKLEPGMLVSLWESHEMEAKYAGFVVVGLPDEMGSEEYPAGTLAVVLEQRCKKGGGYPAEWYVLVDGKQRWVFAKDCKCPGYKPRSRKHETD